MFSVNQALKRIVLLLLLALPILTYQQYDTYLQFRKQLVKHDAENRALMLKIEEIKSQYEDFYTRLSGVTQQYETLRRQLPDEMSLAEFKKTIDGIFVEQGVKVVVQREARYTRSFYSEVRLNYSLKATMESVKNSIDAIAGNSRLVLAEQPRDEGNKNVSFGLSIFSLNQKKQFVSKEVSCLDLPDTLVFPFFKSELRSLYQQYTMTCRALERNDALYKELQRYEYMRTEIQSYRTIIDDILKGQ